jgi:alkanesulfonate monooxygenase SsuD/methylene tetrahydromethanopterin reductase-like flavin-dependent oxidoreductase (luciferase family)
VANVVNRHPAHLASAAATIQSLGRGRVVLGLGAGAGPGSDYAGEFNAIGVDLGDLDTRRRRLIETIQVLRQIWHGGGDHDGEFFTLRGLEAVVGTDVTLPRLIVGASSVGTVRLAAAHADGVNIVGSPGWERLVELACELTTGRDFEISVFMALEPDHPTGGELDSMVEIGVDSRVLAVEAPYPFDRLRAIADRLQSP